MARLQGSKASPMAKHRKRRDSQNSNGNIDYGSVRVLPKVQFAFMPYSRVQGLHNLGNTCYLNSTLQCLSRVSGLKAWIDKLMYNGTVGFLKRFTDGGDTISLKLCLLPRNSPLSTAYSTFVGELIGSQNTRPSISPRPILSELVKTYPRFGNFGQHDSHEALRYLLDGLRLEELKLWQRAILDELECTSKSTEETKNEVRIWGKSTNLCTTVDRMFGGVLLTSLTCSQCNHISLHFEVFLDLSLPILIDEGDANQYRHHNDLKSKTKRELKKERKAKGKNKRKDRNRKCFEQMTEDNDGIDYDQKGPNKQKQRSSRKGKYSKWSLDEECDMADEEEKPEEALNGEEEAEMEEKQLDMKDDASLTPQHTLENGKCDHELSDVLQNGSSGGLPLSSSERDSLEVDIKVTSIESTVSVVEASAANKVNSKKDFQGGEYDDGSESSSLSLNGKDDIGKGRDSRTGSVSAGESADLEDNVDDVNSRLSDGSVLTLPVLPDPETSLCKDLGTKLRLSSAGDETTIAQSDEEEEAKTISVCPILSTPLPGPTGLECCLAKFIEATELIGDNQMLCERCSKRDGGDSVSSESSNTDGVRCDSVKRDLIIKPPPVLTLHLKRYFQCGNRLQKCSKRITFPINLDLRPYCSRLARLSSGEGQYRLFGVVEHSGQLRSGHYVCYVADESEIPDDRFIPSLEKPDPWPLHLHHLVCQLRRGDQHVIHGDLDGTSTDEESKNTDARTWFHFSDTHVSRVPVSTVLSAQPYLLFYQRIR